MLNCGKLLIRVGASHAIVKELSIGLRHSGAKTFCAVAASATIPASEASSTSTTAASKPAPAQKVDTACCGFAKDLIGAPSTVLDNSVFGEDACFVSKYKSIHVAGKSELKIFIKLKFLGVADGVGGWRQYGIDPADFSSNLMRNCSEIVNSGEFQPQRPDLIIANAFHKLAISSSRPIG